MAKQKKEEANAIVKNKGDLSEAVRLYANAIELCPPDEKNEKSVFHNNLGLALKMMDKELQAKGEFTKAIELNPKYTKPLYHRMLIYKQEEEYDKALEDAAKIKEIDSAYL